GILRNDEFGGRITECKKKFVIRSAPGQLDSGMGTINLLAQNNVPKGIVIWPRPGRIHPRRPGELLVRQARSCRYINVAACSKSKSQPNFCWNKRHRVRPGRSICTEQFGEVAFTWPPTD